MTPFQSPTQSSTTLQYALATYLNCLSPSQRKLLSVPADCNDCLQLVRPAQGPKKYHGLLVALQPLIEPLNILEASITALVQMYAGIVSPIWGPLRVLVTLISDRLDTLQNLVVLLDRLVDPLKRLANYEALFSGNHLLQNAIAALYCDLLEFGSRVTRRCARSSLVNVLGSCDKDLLEVSDRIRHHSTEIDIVVNAGSIAEAKKAREAEGVQRQLDIRKDIDRWLSPSNVSDELTKHLSDYMDGSCKWLIADTAFQSTMLGTGPSFLSVIAPPGGGKTTAAAFLTQHLIQSSSGIVLHFFCKSSDAERRTTLYILRSLLWQFLQRDAGLYSTVVQWYYQIGRPVADSPHDVGSMLTACLQSSTVPPPIYIVIDALDECLDGSDLLLALSSATMASNRPVKLFLFSHDPVHWPHMPPLRMETIYLTGDKCRASIDLYIKQRLAQVKALGGHQQESQFAQSILDSADALWLFARLLLDELCQAPSLGEMHRRISGAPRGLNGLYPYIIRAKEAGFSEMELRMARELYLWVDKSEYMPEWLRWRGHNDVVDDEMISVMLSFASAGNQFFHPAAVVERLASPLLEVRFTTSSLAVDQNGIPYEAANFVVDFVHQAAKQCLTWSLEAKATELPQSLKPRRLAPLYRGVTAIWYFSQSHQFAGHLQQLRDNPRNGTFSTYLEMGYGLWGALKSAGPREDLDADEMSQAGMLYDQLCGFLVTEQCLPWIEAGILSNHGGTCNGLIENVEDVLQIRMDRFAPVPAFQRFHGARQALMTDLIYALASTWPRSDLPQRTAARAGNTPHGFYQRPVARKIMHLATQYQWLLASACSTPSNSLWMDRQV